MTQRETPSPDQTPVPVPRVATAGRIDLEVETTGLRWGLVHPLIGKGRIIVTPQALTMLIGKKKFNAYAIPWKEVRQLVMLEEDGSRFRLNIGPGGSDLILNVHIQSGDLEVLAVILRELPREAFLPKCPRCGGAVSEGVCHRCGTNLRMAYRSRGLVTLISGVAMAAVGAGAFYISASNVGSGGGVIFGGGAVIFGLMMILMGLFRVVFGIRGGDI